MLLHSGGLAGVDAQTEWTRFMLIFVKAPDSESGCEPYGVLGPNQF